MNDFIDPPNSDDDDCVERSTIEVDLYGIKAKVKPADSSERPASWSDVGRRLNRHLMTIAERLLGVFADTFIAIGNIVRGIGAVPDAIAQRISGAHKRADQLEANRQQAAASSQVLLLTSGVGHETLEHTASLEELLNQLRANGASVELFRRDDGRWVLVIVPPGLVPDAKILAESVRPSDPQKKIQRVNALFAKSRDLCHYKIDVDIIDGRLLLMGTVASFAHKQLATELARNASDMPVVNDLRVIYQVP